MGLHRAGYEVTGVDIAPQPHYPFRFIQADALTLDPEWLRSFDLIWASPPCQRFTRGSGQKATRHLHPDLIGATRELLGRAGQRWVIENIPSSPGRRDVKLCGAMFGLRLIRHRVFEISGYRRGQPAHRPHRPDYVTVTGKTGGSSKRDGARGYGKLADWQEAMGIDWLPANRLREAIPPIYAEYVAPW